MTRNHRTQFAFQLLLAALFMVVAFLSYPTSSIWWLWGLLSFYLLVRNIQFGIETQRQGNWDEAYWVGDSQKQKNSYQAGYWAFWGMIICLLVGGLLYYSGSIRVDPFMLSSVVVILGIAVFLTLRLFFNSRNSG